MKLQAQTIDNTDAHAVGFRTACNILDKWKVSLSQKLHILRLPKATYYKYASNPDTARLDRDQLTRISYILNIHAALRTIFTNRENVYGFMAMDNNNPYFNGRSPLSIIASGDMIDLYEVARRVDSLRGAQW